jgi:serine/threonine protein kinase/tetratricopeptide (TPR) repeat protein
MSADLERPSTSPFGGEVSLSKGATIGRYVVLGPVGRGNMGEVYAAYDPELDRKIAVKLLRARGGAATLDGRTRLLREAQAIARLSHPNVVVVYDVGTFQDSVFIAMEFVEGHTLGYWLQAKPRSWREVLDVFLAAGRGLVAAHAAGLVHRDFKPENVMITKTGQVRVMDFGLAREEVRDVDASHAVGAMDIAARAAIVAATINPAANEATVKLDDGAPQSTVSGASGGYLSLKLTRTGAMLGTPAYMAPEQFAGAGSDARTDQFAFSVALYEGLYGHRPFSGDNLPALMASVVAGTIVDAPENARVPSWIRRVLLRSLSPRIDDRFPSMAEMLAALSQDPAVRRRRWAAAATIVGLGVAMAAGASRLSAGQRAMCAGGPARAGTAWGPDRHAAVERAFQSSGHKHAAQTFAATAGLLDAYVARWTSSYREACEATQVRGDQSAEVLDLRMECLNERLSSARALTEVFAAADQGVVDNAISAAGALPSPDRCADVAMLRAVVRPPDNPATRAEVAKLREDVAKVNALASAGRCDQARKVGEPVLLGARRLGYKPLEAEIAYALGGLFDTCLEPKEALADLEDAVMAAEASRHDEIAIEASAMLGSAYVDLAHDVRLGRQWVRLAEAILARFPNHPLLEARVAACRAIVLGREGRFEDSLREETRVLDIRTRAFGASNVEVAMSHNNIATSLHDLGRDAEAAASIRRAIEIFATLLGEDNGRVALASLNECEILTALGRYEGARAAIKTALRIWRQQGASAFYIGLGLLYQGKLELAEQNPHAAVISLEEALTRLGTQDPHQTADARFALARALVMESPANRGRALDLVREARGAIAGEPGSQDLATRMDSWEKEHEPASKVKARL